MKIYAGSVNVVSGETIQEDLSTIVGRQNSAAEAKSLQDYVVLPQQKWLDGIATAPGVVGQFCAMPNGLHYSVEAQLTGKETLSGLVFEITPAKAQVARELTSSMQIFIRNLYGNYVTLDVPPIMNVEALKEEIERTEGVPALYQRLTFEGKELNDENLLWHRGIKQVHLQNTERNIFNLTTNKLQSSTITLLLRLSGGLDPSALPVTPPSATLSLAKGGQIKQSIQPDLYNPAIWHPSHTLAFNLHLINSELFPSITGAAAPPTPITALTYAAAGLPFYDMKEEQSPIHGGANFASVKSIAEIENRVDEEMDIESKLVQLDSKGRQTAKAAYEDLKKATHDPDGLLDPKGPMAEFRTLSDLDEDVARLSLKVADN